MATSHQLFLSLKLAPLRSLWRPSALILDEATKMMPHMCSKKGIRKDVRYHCIACLVFFTSSLLNVVLLFIVYCTYVSLFYGDKSLVCA